MIAIVTDSTCDIPEQYCRESSVHVVPLYVRFGARSYREGVDLSLEEFYSRMKARKELSTTSQPSPGDFLLTYQNLIEEGKSVISIHISEKVSGTVNAARNARSIIQEDNDEADITIIDSRIAGAGLGMMVERAVEMASQGVEKKEIVKALMHFSESAYAVGIVPDLDHLYRGGRISKGQAVLGDLLNVIPVIQMENGEISLIAKLRGMNAAMKHVMECIRRKASESPPSFMSTFVGTSRDRGEELYDMIEREFPQIRHGKFDLGAVTGTHLGVASFGVMWI